MSKQEGHAEELPLLWCYPFPSPLPFILMRAQLIRKWNGFPKEAGSSTMEAFFCQWLYWIPLQGHWAILKAISSITPPPPPPFCSLPFFLILKVSWANLCHSIIWSPNPHPHPSAPSADFTILRIDLLGWNHHLLCMLGLFDDRAEGRGSWVTHHLADNWCRCGGLEIEGSGIRSLVVFVCVRTHSNSTW